MPRTIVVPVDLGQQDAGVNAVAEARQYDSRAKLILLYVLAPVLGYVAAEVPDGFLELNRQRAQKELRALADRAGVARDADLVIRRGHPGREILSHAEEAKADLIVIASHDPGWSDLILGSVAAFVVSHSHCSVFVVRQTTG